MLTEKDIAELESMTLEQLQATVSIMSFQFRAPLFIGDKKRSQAVYDKAAFLLINGIIDHA